MRILLVSPFPCDVARGNSVAAARLAHGFGAPYTFIKIRIFCETFFPTDKNDDVAPAV